MDVLSLLKFPPPLLQLQRNNLRQLAFHCGRCPICFTFSFSLFVVSTIQHTHFCSLSVCYSWISLITNREATQKVIPTSVSIVSYPVQSCLTRTTQTITVNCHCKFTSKWLLTPPHEVEDVLERWIALPAVQPALDQLVSTLSDVINLKHLSDRY